MSVVGYAHSVLITGASAGSIGSALALAFADHDFLTFATSRDISRIAANLSSHPLIHVVQLDVTSPTSIEEAVASVLEETGGSLGTYYLNRIRVGAFVPPVALLGNHSLGDEGGPALVRTKLVNC